MPPDTERLSQRLLREAGFTKVEVRGKTGDGGIDGDRLCDLLKQYALGVKTEMVEQVTIAGNCFATV